MNNSVDTIMVFLVLTNLMLLGTSRLGTCIRVVAIQGIALGLLPLFLHRNWGEIHLWLLAGAIMGLKGGVFPWLLSRTLRESNDSREDEPFVGYGLSVVTGPLALATCFWVSSRLPLSPQIAPSLVVPVALFTIMVGLFLIVSRKKALTQVLGYLVLENGIYTFGVALAQKQPLLVEMGILLDVFAAVFVMGIIIFHINREFDHIDTDQLSSLRS
ncbi:MAG: NADH-quinone oxidoreductase subunit K [Phycisphaerae bacterium]